MADRLVTWLKCPGCKKVHVAPPTGAFACPCGDWRWNFGWTKLRCTPRIASDTP